MSNELAISSVNTRDLSKTESALFNRQSQVLEATRIHGDLMRAATEVDEDPITVAEWYERDLISFRARVRAVQATKGHELDAMLFRQVMEGKVKSPTIVKMVLEAWLPEKYGKVQLTENDAREVLELLRSYAQKADEITTAAVESPNGPDPLQLPEGDGSMNALRQQANRW